MDLSAVWRDRMWINLEERQAVAHRQLDDATATRMKG
jgi:hypothetical protein